MDLDFLVCVVAIGSGFLVAKTAGSRNSGDSISGEIRMSPRTLLIQASVAPREEAIEIYNQVLENLFEIQLILG